MVISFIILYYSCSRLFSVVIELNNLSFPLTCSINQSEGIICLIVLVSLSETPLAPEKSDFSTCNCCLIYLKIWLGAMKSVYLFWIMKRPNWAGAGVVKNQCQCALREITTIQSMFATETAVEGLLHKHFFFQAMKGDGCQYKIKHILEYLLEIKDFQLCLMVKTNQQLDCALLGMGGKHLRRSALWWLYFQCWGRGSINLTTSTLHACIMVSFRVFQLDCALLGMGGKHLRRSALWWLYFQCWGRGSINLTTSTDR